MRDWAIDYILHVLEKKDWSMNRLAKEAHVSASTINRPLRDPDWPHKLSRDTIAKIREASGIDPSPFIPTSFAEDAAVFSADKPSPGDEALQIMLAKKRGAATPLNEIKVVMANGIAEIHAVINREGIAKLRKKIDAIESMLED